MRTAMKGLNRGLRFKEAPLIRRVPTMTSVDALIS
jgi:hypothetical protein